MAVFGRDFPLLIIVYFVRDHIDAQVFTPDLPCLIDPSLHVLKAGPRGDVVTHDSDGRVVDVAGDQAAEAFLPRSVPQLEPHGPIVHIHCLSQKVNSNRRLETEVRVR